MGIRTTLERRADVWRTIRGLFDAAGFLEVDTPVLAAITSGVRTSAARKIPAARCMYHRLPIERKAEA